MVVKEKLLSIGVYPTVSLKEAREKRDKAKKDFVNNQASSTFKQQT